MPGKRIQLAGTFMTGRSHQRRPSIRQFSPLPMPMKRPVARLKELALLCQRGGQRERNGANVAQVFRTSKVLPGAIRASATLIAVDRSDLVADHLVDLFARPTRGFSTNA